MLTLRLFGGLSLADEGGPLTGRAAQRRRLALLAILAVAGGKPVSRDKLVALLRPEASDERARHLLADSLYVIHAAA
jgi:DNA-binding SARP family transcriptional activator